MAASVYATPPPDHLSGDETALSDVSNSSQLSNRSNSANALNCSISTTSLLNNSTTEIAQSTTTTTTTSTTKTTSSPIPFAANINLQIPSIIETTTRATTTKTNETGSTAIPAIAPINDNGSNSNSVDDINDNNTLNVHNLSSFLLDSLPDNGKKRRKQSTPIRITAEAAAAAAIALNAKNAATVAAMAAKNENNNSNDENNIDDGKKPITKAAVAAATAAAAAMAANLPRIYLSNISQLQNKTFIDEQLGSENDDNIFNERDNEQNKDDDEQQKQQQERQERRQQRQQQINSELNESLMKKFVNNLNCDQCGLKLDSEIKLGLHILQEHGPRHLYNNSSGGGGNSVDEQHQKHSSEDEIPKMYVKKEQNITSANDWENDEKLKQLSNGNGGGLSGLGGSNLLKPEEWLSLSGLPFPFPPEAAAMLSASGYLSQLPLLGVPPFGSADGLTRSNAPPLRIFNPEAYCELCNKEFCNKYFLKTHKANKHNIYEPPTIGNDLPSTSQLNHINQVFQMHQQIAQNQQQIMSPGSPTSQQQNLATTSTSSSGNASNRSDTNQNQSACAAASGSANSQELPIFCDICFKRFANVFAMRRHRSKAHEIPPPSSTTSSSNDNNNLIADTKGSNSSTPLMFGENFREDYSIEQEDASFTPQPRKMSPLSIQQARESNFSYDKLKRLGVINPEAFCELCGKEYCNKYFLRTHKLKRHSILMPPDDLPGGSERHITNAAQMAAAWQLMQNAPLNLMITNAEQLQQHAHQQQQHHHHHHRKKQLEAGEIRKFSFDSGDDNDYERPTKKRKTSIDKKSSNDDDDNDSNDHQIGNKTPDETTIVSNQQQQQQQDTEAISVDLQKLQSMIMQLNDLNAQRPLPCGICGKEQENQFVMHTHMLTEHGNIGDNNNGIKQSPISTPPPMPPTSTLQQQQQQQQTTPSNSIEICKQCDKEFPNLFLLNQHLYEIHGVQPSSPIRDGFVTPDRPINASTVAAVAAGLGQQQQSAALARPYTITPTSSYCEICNKELCNKYFMKTHMQRMHGIEIENGAQIGGVVCNVCNKELCSKYFLRVHKHNTHGIIEEGSPLPQPRQNGDNNNSSSSSSVVGIGGIGNGPNGPNSSGSGGGPSSVVAVAAAAAAVAAANQMDETLFPSLDPSIKHIDENDINNRYYAHFNEICPLCNRRFRGVKWLRTHLMTDHGKIGTDKLREIEQQLINLPKSTSPTLKIPNGGGFGLVGSINDTNFLQKHHSLANLFAGEEAINTTNIQKNKEYQCSYCSFSTPSYAFLFIHERSHSLLAMNSSNNGDAHSLNNENNADNADIKNENLTKLQQQNSNDRTSPVSSTRDPSPTSITITTTKIDATGTTTPQPINPIDLIQSNEQHEKFQQQQQHEAQNILHSMANLTQRPTTYAIPQEIENGMFMQSFLLEPINSNDNNNGHNDNDVNKLSTSSSSASKKTKFVPSVVFLPVKERITGKTIVSFTLTPA